MVYKSMSIFGSIVRRKQQASNTSVSHGPVATKRTTESVALQLAQQLALNRAEIAYYKEKALKLGVAEFDPTTVKL